MIKRAVAILVLIAWVTPTSAVALEPHEIAIIAARGNRESEALARYYARVRGVPEENICLVDVPAGEVLPREMWRWGVRPEIHKWLVERDPEQQLRCLVTMWGMPLKIAAAAADAESRKYERFLEAERSHRLKLLAQIADGFDSLAPDATAPTAEPGAPMSGAGAAAGFTSEDLAVADAELAAADAADQPSSDLERLQTQLEAALQRCQARLAARPEGNERERGQLQLQQLATAAGGLNVLLPALGQRVAADAAGSSEVRSEFDALRGRAAAFVEAKSLLEQMPSGIERDALVLALIERFGGLIATVAWLDQQLATVRKNETGASFDSELSLVMWPDGYQLLRWQPNYLRPEFGNSQLPTVYRTLMVSRIDAPTVRLAKGLIDTAIEVEESGLSGKLYIDARGLAKLDDTHHPPGSYGDYDRSLLITAQAIAEQTDLEVVLEETPRLFQPGECPEAALYCGWYSLAKYVDAFEWVPGAVAYHLASAEAATLRDPASQVWCKRMLEEGVCATIGPVYEPYLSAFPRPDEFFALLLRGDLTLVECYYHTLPHTSWMMTLIGDPLYRPFKHRDRAAAGDDSQR